MGTGSVYLDLPDVKKSIDSIMFDQNRQTNHFKLPSPGYRTDEEGKFQCNETQLPLTFSQIDGGCITDCGVEYARCLLRVNKLISFLLPDTNYIHH